MNNRRLIVLSFEGLATSALGCYGSSWNSTPAIDAIAGGGCVWDRWTTTSDNPLRLMDQWIHRDTPEWMAAWKSSGSVELWTDDQRIIDQGTNTAFDHSRLVAHSPTADPDQLSKPLELQQPATEIEQTQYGRLIAAVIERDAEPDPWSVLWLHSRFLTQRWDAPRSLYELDQDDELNTYPSDEVELLAEPGSESALPRWEALQPIFTDLVPPSLALNEDSHPDLVNSWMRTYGCQVNLIDVLIEVFLNALQEEDPHVLIVGTSGFNLGQNGWIGHSVGPLRSCDLRLPLIVSDEGPLRAPQLTGSDTLPSILTRLADDSQPLVPPETWIEADGEFLPRIVTQSSRAETAVTSSRWYFVRERDETEHLFLKPDDLEDVNDVGRLESEAAERMSSD